MMHHETLREKTREQGKLERVIGKNEREMRGGFMDMCDIPVSKTIQMANNTLTD